MESTVVAMLLRRPSNEPIKPPKPMLFGWLAWATTCSRSSKKCSAGAVSPFCSPRKPAAARSRVAGSLPASARNMHHIDEIFSCACLNSADGRRYTTSRDHGRGKLQHRVARQPVKWPIGTQRDVEKMAGSRVRRTALRRGARPRGSPQAGRRRPAASPPLHLCQRKRPCPRSSAKRVQDWCAAKAALDEICSALGIGVELMPAAIVQVRVM